MGGIRLRIRWCRCRGLGSGGFLSDVSMGGFFFLRFLMGIVGWGGRGTYAIGGDEDVGGGAVEDLHVEGEVQLVVSVVDGD